MNEPVHTPDTASSWRNLQRETSQTADQFRQKVLIEIKSHAIQLGIRLTHEDIFESGFLSPHISPELRSIIVQCRKVLDAFGALERAFPKEQ